MQISRKIGTSLLALSLFVTTLLSPIYAFASTALTDNIDNMYKSMHSALDQQSTLDMQGQLSGRGTVTRTDGVLNFTYTGNGSGSTIWTSTISDSSYHDWSSGKYLALDIKNNTSIGSKIGFYISETGSVESPNTGAEQWKLTDGAAVYFRTKADPATVTEVKASGMYIEIPADFDGYMLIPLNQNTNSSMHWESSNDGVLNLSNIYALNYQFNADSIGLNISLRDMGLAYSDKIRDGSIPIITNQAIPTDDIDNIYQTMHSALDQQSTSDMQGQLGGRGTVTRTDGVLDLTYTGNGSGSTIWTSTISDSSYHDWSSGKYLALDIKNNTSIGSKIGFYISEAGSVESPNTGAEQWKLTDGASVYFRTKADPVTVTEVKASGMYVEIPANFDGYMLIPLNQNTISSMHWESSNDGVLNLSNIYALNYQFNADSIGLNISLRDMGLAYSDKIRDGSIPIITNQAIPTDDIDNKLQSILGVLQQQVPAVMQKQLNGKGTVTRQDTTVRFTYNDDVAGDNTGATIWTSTFLSATHFDWSSGKYLALEVKNNASNVSKVGFYISESGSDTSNPNTGAEQWTLKSGALVYFRTKADPAKVTNGATNGMYVEIPADFDGYLLIPLDQNTLTSMKWQETNDGVLDLRKIYAFNYQFDDGSNDLDFSISDIALAYSHKILDGSIPTIYSEDSELVIKPEEPAKDDLENDLKLLTCSYSDQSASSMNTSLNLNSNDGVVTKSGEKIHVTYSDSGSDGATIWTKQFSVTDDYNWTQYKYLAMDVKNNNDHESAVGFYISEAGNDYSPSSNSEHWVLKPGATVYLRSRTNDGTATVSSFIATDMYVTIPAKFDGYVLIRLNQDNLSAVDWSQHKDNILDLTKIYSVNYQFAEGTQDLDMSFGIMGLASSLNAAQGSIPFVISKDIVPVVVPEDNSVIVPDAITATGNSVVDLEQGTVYAMSGDVVIDYSKAQSLGYMPRYVHLDAELYTKGNVSVYAVDSNGKESLIANFVLDSASRDIYFKTAKGFDYSNFNLRAKFTNGATGKLYGISFLNSKDNSINPKTSDIGQHALPILLCSSFICLLAVISKKKCIKKVCK